MVNFKIIKEESFENLNQYLRLIYQLADGTNPFAFVNVDGKDYMITNAEDNDYAVVYKKGDNYKLVGTHLVDDDNFAVCDEETSCVIYPSGDILRESQLNGFRESLVLYKSIESEPKVTLNFSQVDPINRRDVYMHYRLEGYENPLVTLNYMHNRVPIEVVIDKYPLILEHEKRYAYCDRRYYRYLRVNDDIIRALPFLKNYSYEALMDYIQSMGFNTTIPKELVDVYKNENSEIKVLKKVTEEYKKNTRL